jgi:tRNA dimethylallyltransferase
MSVEARKPIYIVGSTATGKSQASLEIAREFSGTEVISLDKGAAVYEMDIGTAKLNLAERAEVPHHLIDIIHMAPVYARPLGIRVLNDDFGTCPPNITALMSTEARTQFRRIQRGGNTAVFVGGAGVLYSTLYDGHEFPGNSFRDQRLYELHSGSSEGSLRRYLRGINEPLPFVDTSRDTLFEHVLEANRREETPLHIQGTTIGIEIPEETLVKRISVRTDTMMEQGLEAEVEDLIDRYGWRHPLTTTIGYMEFQGRLPRRDNNKNLKDVIDDINARTLRYARRQRNWLRRRPEVQWVGSPSEAVDLAMQQC